jgi:type II secretory pathway component PulF
MTFFDKIERGYAKFTIKNSSKSRLRFYRKMASLLRNNFTVMDALDKLWIIETDNGKDTHEPMAIAIRAWQEELESGATFADAIKNWVPQRESLMLTVGDVSKLEHAFLNVIKVNEGMERIIQPIISAFAYPSFLLLLTLFIIIMVGKYLVPELTAMVQQDFKWEGIARSLVVVSYVVENYWWVLIAAFLAFAAAAWFSMGRWTGKVRVYFDKIPPWSFYRMFSGVSWMFSLSTLIQAGVPLAKAMKVLSNGSSPYLSERLDDALWYISNGENLGAALRKTGYGFPDKETIGDLSVYSELDNFEEALASISDDVLETNIRKIEAQAAILNTVAILLIAVTIAWVVYGTFEMQDQITQRI